MTNPSQWRILTMAFALFANWLNNCHASGTFSNTGSLNLGRVAHTATLLPNGNVLVAGGVNNDVPNNPTAEIYSPESRSWTNTTAMTVGRHEHTATLLPSGKVLVVGGVNSSQSIANAELYDPADGKWTTIAPPSRRRHGHSATLLPNGKVLIAGGYNSNTALDTAEVFDPNSQTWQDTGVMVVERGHHAAALLLNGNVIVAGGAIVAGDGTPVFLSSVETYNPVSGTWTLANEMREARSGATATLLFDGDLLVAGGSKSSGSSIPGAELFRSGQGAWESVASMSEGRWSATATRLNNGKVLLAGGYNQTNAVVASAEVYDPITKNWTPSEPMDAARWGATATLLQDGEVLLAGGSDPTTYLRSTELFKFGPTFCSPHKATATLQVVNGFIVGVTITDSGCGYTNPPVVLIQGGGGSGATASAVVSDGIVVAIRITNAGCCYTGNPTLAIASPPFEPTVSISVSKVKVSQKVVLGRNYLLEASFDFTTWTATGPPFTANSEIIISEFDVIESGRYFRIQEVP